MQMTGAVLRDTSGCDAIADQVLSSLQNRQVESSPGSASKSGGGWDDRDEVRAAMHRTALHVLDSLLNPSLVLSSLVSLDNLTHISVAPAPALREHFTEHLLRLLPVHTCSGLRYFQNSIRVDGVCRARNRSPPQAMNDSDAPYRTYT